MIARLSRRAFLRGIGGFGVALPVLDLMLTSSAQAQAAIPKRYLVGFAGTSIGTHTDLVVPDDVGALQLSRGLASLGGDMALGYQSVVDEFSLVSGLMIPWDTGAGAPAGGRPRNWHTSSMSPLLAGVRSRDTSASVHGPTSDQIVADALQSDTRFRTLEYRVQSDHYRNGEANSNKGRMSWRRDQSGNIVPNDPIASPRIAFDQLFRGFEPADPTEAAQAAFALKKDKSVLDLVRRSAEGLMGQVGTEDRHRLQRHFDEIRDLENRLSDLGKAEGICQLPEDPGEDPDTMINMDHEANDGRTVGWSDENRRARLLSDFLYMALACDQVRVATYLFSFAQSFMSMRQVLDVSNDLHDLSHHGANQPENMSDAISWQLKYWAYLIDKLRGTREGAGSMLDNTVLTILFEGGWGFDPETGAQAAAHSSERMVALVAGRAGGLKGNKHIRIEGGHPAQVLSSAMRAVGVEQDLGEVQGHISELFG